MKESMQFMIEVVKGYIFGISVGLATNSLSFAMTFVYRMIE